MKLYVTPNSPYARMARVVVLEKHLEDRVQIAPAATRRVGSEYYGINPSGRVPYLVLDDGTGLEDSTLICAYLDHIDDKPVLDPPSGPDGWQVRRLEALARSLMDGQAVRSRELTRPENERSPTILEHERVRGRRMIDLWEREIEHACMHGPLNMAQLTLACALDRGAGPARWESKHPSLSAWLGHIAARPSLQATRPPAP